MAKTRILAVMLAGSAMMGLGGTANAALVISSITSNSGNAAPTADIKYVPTNKSLNNVKVTGFNVVGTLNGNAVSLFTYCVDIFQTIHSGTYSVLSLSDFLGGNTTKANYIAALIGNVGADGSATHDAAVQLALWELLYENTGTTPSFSSDNFRASDISSSTLSTAKTYAKNARTIWTPAANIDVQIAKSSSYQDQLFWTVRPPAVPEPATWAMMIAGFGAVGSAMRRQRGRTTLSLA